MLDHRLTIAKLKAQITILRCEDRITSITERQILHTMDELDEQLQAFYRTVGDVAFADSPDDPDKMRTK